MSEQPTFDNLSQVYGDLSTAIDGINHEIYEEIYPRFARVEKAADDRNLDMHRLVRDEAQARVNLEQKFIALANTYSTHGHDMHDEATDDIYKALNELRERLDRNDQHSRYTDHTFNENVRAHRNFEMLIVGAIALAAFALGRKS